MHTITIYRKPDAWELVDDRSYPEMTTALAVALERADRLGVLTAIEVANCNEETDEYDPTATPFLLTVNGN